MERTGVSVTTKDLAAMFGVQPMTIWIWRRGSKRRSPLPSFTIPRGTKRNGVRFDLKETLEWAKRHKVKFDARYLGRIQKDPKLPKAA